MDDVNPVGLGRRSRQLFDDVWRRLTDLGQLTSSTRPSDEFDYEKVVVGGPMCDFTTPNAELTTVLVAGATGRVGRILVRKLQLRGYKVKVCAVLIYFHNVHTDENMCHLSSEEQPPNSGFLKLL